MPPPAPPAARLAPPRSSGPSRLRSYWVLGGVLMVSAAPAAAQEGGSQVTGTVVARETGQPVAAARVSVSGARLVVVTDSAGGFVLRGVAPGRRTVEVRHLGYVDSRTRVRVLAGEPAHLDVVLEVEPVLMEALAVVAEPLPHATAKMRGFHERRVRERGYFVTREQIDRRRATEISQLLTNVPGVFEVADRRGTGTSVRSERTRGLRDCPITIYVDGAYYAQSVHEISTIRPQDVEAIEFYQGTSQVPAQFRGSFTNCGVLVIWLRERH
jgi:hypothetical protein